MSPLSIPGERSHSTAAYQPGSPPTASPGQPLAHQPLHGAPGLLQRGIQRRLRPAVVGPVDQIEVQVGQAQPAQRLPAPGAVEARTG